METKLPRKLVVPDASGRTSGLQISINWNTQVAGAKYLKLRVGTEEIVVKKAYLESIMFFLADEENRHKHVQSTKKTYKYKKIRTNLFVKAQKDIPKDEMIIIPYWTTVPEDYDESNWKPDPTQQVRVV